MQLLSYFAELHKTSKFEKVRQAAAASKVPPVRAKLCERAAAVHKALNAQKAAGIAPQAQAE